MFLSFHMLPISLSNNIAKEQNRTEQNDYLSFVPSLL